MRTTKTLLAITATAALTFSLASCTGGSGEGGALTWEDSPLAEYWNAGYDPSKSEEEQQAEFASENAAREEFMAQCMVDEGFEYIPNIDNGSSISFGEEVEWEPDKKEWVEKYGYGMINNPYSEMSGEEPTAEPQEYIDPNQSYIESLSASEQQAYYETLYGKMEEPEPDENGEISYEYSWETAGCSGAAQHEIGGDANELWTQFEDLTTRMSELYTQTEESPEAVELDSKWSSCMADAGFVFEKQSEANMSFNDELNKLYEGLTDEDWASGEDPLKNNPEYVALGEKEIETALADLECRNKFNYTDAKLKIQFALEEQFVKDNSKELAEFKSAMEQASKK